MSEMKQRISAAIARAIIKYNGREAIFPDPHGTDFTETIADAVLEEMRELTFEMLIPEPHTFDLVADRISSERRTEIWLSMIDEARK